MLSASKLLNCFDLLFIPSVCSMHVYISLEPGMVPKILILLLIFQFFGYVGQTLLSFSFFFEESSQRTELTLIVVAFVQISYTCHLELLPNFIVTSCK